MTLFRDYSKKGGGGATYYSSEDKICSSHCTRSFSFLQSLPIRSNGIFSFSLSVSISWSRGVVSKTGGSLIQSSPNAPPAARICNAHRRTTTHSPRLNCAKLHCQNHPRRYRLPLFYRQFLGHSLLASRRFHSCLHDRAWSFRQVEG